MVGPISSDPNVKPEGGDPGKPEETLIFGKFKTQEEAEAAYNQSVENSTTQAETIKGMQTQIDELAKKPPADKPKEGAEEENIFSDAEAGLFDAPVLSAIRKLIAIEGKKSAGLTMKTVMKTVQQQNLVEKARGEAEDWLIENFSNDNDPEMDIRNEKGKLFALSQKIWKTTYGENPLFQKHAVLEANHQLGGQATKPSAEKPEEKREVVGAFAPGANYTVGPKGKEMPWDEFVKLPEWRREEILAEESAAKVSSLLNR
jgi:hypothetical protein